MKKLLLFFTVVLFVSCSSDDDTGDQSINKDELTGNWIYSRGYFEGVNEGVTDNFFYGTGLNIKTVNSRNELIGKINYPMRYNLTLNFTGYIYDGNKFRGGAVVDNGVKTYNPPTYYPKRTETITSNDGQEITVEGVSVSDGVIRLDNNELNISRNTDNYRITYIFTRN